MDLQSLVFSLVFLGAFSPLPYKVIAIGAGIGGFGLLPFILTSIIGRGLRFTIVAGIAKNNGNPRVVILLITILVCFFAGRFMANQMTPTFIPPIASDLALSLLAAFPPRCLVALYYFNMLADLRLAVCASGNDGRISQ